MKKRFVLFNLILIISSIFMTNLSAEDMELLDEGPKKFEFKYRDNDSYRILSVVKEIVFYNGMRHHSAEIINRVSVNVTDVDDENKTALHTGTFMTSEQSVLENKSRQSFSYGEEYKSVFKRDNLGVYSIDDEYFMPVVRDVPVFPDREISCGESWTYKGHEAHDLRRTFNLNEPYKVPFTANYSYLGVSEQDGKKLDVFRVNYNLEFSMDPVTLGKVSYETPKTTSGFSNQIIFWDNEKGSIDHYTETFFIIIDTTFGNTLMFRGNAEAKVTDFTRTATVENVEDVTKKINELGIKDVNVTATEKGLTLSIENIQFKPDSDILMDSEKEKLLTLAEILKEYPDNELLITGHTALRGTQQEQQLLSEMRAQAVADFLISNNVKDSYHVYTQGKGAELPVAPNTTEEGRAKNRRVEITIMDK